MENSNIFTKCVKCGKIRGEHQAKTLNCPTGSKTKIGYISFALLQKFQHKS